ncbi:MAG: undecaprenyldiphospho-muramoylpentapeptide beta-N-acetylglucosaminyltransferase [Desulfarculales bacterium]|jgi:UDP-N-acetylglucosamine--N-acetylmuramyl-(pentapeptide) pyrophosphoryl-undecaprenol N-acetylglucosamine transferase|nr:undecaprenyldiphospho-muramoylpentapeptide beta-N-acetylglucosaminyltransferase [Desulfarculales bacterium]
MKMIIAGGGTGGHLFPALAIAGAMMKLYPDTHICFVNAGGKMDMQVMPASGFDFEVIKARPFRGRAFGQRIASLWSAYRGFRQSKKLLKKHEPDLVLAVGGYAALPMGLAARVKNIPLLIQEQNAVLGLVNSILSRFAVKIFLGFNGAEKKIGAEKCLFTGNPVRPEILRQAESVTRDDSVFTVLVWGGSQGAESINQALLDALPCLSRHREYLRFIHQTGAGKAERVSHAYQKNGFQAEVREFFSEPGICYQRSHLVICRGGAASLSEMMALGRTGLCIPYPYAAGDHQTENARILVNLGAMEYIDDKELNGLQIAEFIERMRSNRPLREKREILALNYGRRDAAEIIAAYCRQMMERN